MPIQQGWNQLTPATTNLLRRVMGGARGASSRRSSANGKGKSNKKSSGGTLREYKVKSKRAPKPLKFGSKAYRAKYLKNGGKKKARRKK